MSTHNLCFKQKCEKYQSFLSENFQFLEVKISIYLNRRVFVMVVSAWNQAPHLSSCFCWSFQGVSSAAVLLCFYVAYCNSVFVSCHCLFLVSSSFRDSGMVCFVILAFPEYLYLYSKISMARTSLGPWKFIRDMGSSSHWGLIMALGQEAYGDNLGIPL